MVLTPVCLRLVLVSRLADPSLQLHEAVEDMMSTFVPPSRPKSPVHSIVDDQETALFEAAERVTKSKPTSFERAEVGVVARDSEVLTMLQRRVNATSVSELPVYPTARKRFRTEQRLKWAEETLDPAVFEKLNDRYGKPSSNQCFKSEATLRHVLLPMMKRGFLDARDREALKCGCF